MSSYTTEIVLLIVLLGLSGFFSMSETALMAITKIRMRTMLDEGVKGAKLLDKLLQNRNHEGIYAKIWRMVKT